MAGARTASWRRRRGSRTRRMTSTWIERVERRLARARHCVLWAAWRARSCCGVCARPQPLLSIWRHVRCSEDTPRDHTHKHHMELRVPPEPAETIVVRARARWCVSLWLGLFQLCFNESVESRSGALSFAASSPLKCEVRSHTVCDRDRRRPRAALRPWGGAVGVDKAHTALSLSAAQNL